MWHLHKLPVERLGMPERGVMLKRTPARCPTRKQRLLLLLTYSLSPWVASLATLTNTEGRVWGELHQALKESRDRV